MDMISWLLHPHLSGWIRLQAYQPTVAGPAIRPLPIEIVTSVGKVPPQLCLLGGYESNRGVVACRGLGVEALRMRPSPARPLTRSCPIPPRRIPSQPIPSQPQSPIPSLIASEPFRGEAQLSPVIVLMRHMAR